MRSFLLFISVAAVLLLAVDANPNTAYINAVSVDTQLYNFAVRWTGYSIGELHLGSCKYALEGVYSDEQHASTNVTETSLLDICGFVKEIGEQEITIRGSTAFYSQASNDNQLLYKAEVIITYPLVVEALTQVSIQVLGSLDVGVDPIIPSKLSLCGEDTLSDDDPRLTTTVGSSLCFRHSLVSTSSSQLALESLEVRLGGGNPITSSVSRVVDTISTNSYVEYWVLLESGACKHCQLTSTIVLRSTGVNSRLERVFTRSPVRTTTLNAVAGTELNIIGGDSSATETGEDPVFTMRQRDAVQISILIVVGLLLVATVVGIIAHHLPRA